MAAVVYFYDTDLMLSDSNGTYGNGLSEPDITLSLLRHNAEFPDTGPDLNMLMEHSLGSPHPPGPNLELNKPGWLVRSKIRRRRKRKRRRKKDNKINKLIIKSTQLNLLLVIYAALLKITRFQWTNIAGQLG